MGDELNKTYTWICPKCEHRYEETDIGLVEVRVQTHRCNKSTVKDKYLESILAENKLGVPGGKG